MTNSDLKKKAHDFMYLMWESGVIDQGFTESHELYSDAIEEVIKTGKLPPWVPLNKK